MKRCIVLFAMRTKGDVWGWWGSDVTLLYFYLIFEFFLFFLF